MNLSLGQSGWDEIFERWGLLIRIYHWLKEYQQYKMVQNRKIGQSSGGVESNSEEVIELGATIVQEFEGLAASGLPNPESLRDWELEGVSFDNNTDNEGILYITQTSGNVVSVYKDSARANLVAQGTGTPPVRITLTEQNDSGLSGSVFLKSAVAVDHKYRLLCRPDWQTRLREQFPEENEEDLRILYIALTNLSTLSGRVSDIISTWKTSIEELFISSFLKNKLQSVQTTILRIEHSQLEGTITIKYFGILQDLVDAMKDDTVPQTIRKCVAIPSSVQASPTNFGKGSVTVSLFEHAKPGRVTLKCTDATIGSERFSISFKPDEWWEFGDLNGFFEALVRRIYRDNNIGIESLMINRTIEDTDGSNIYSEWAMEGELMANTSAGKLYAEYDLDAHLTKFFADYSRTVLVATCPYAGTNQMTVISEWDGSGLSGSAKMTSEPSDGYQFEVLLNPFAKGDVFTFTISQTRSGLIQKYFGDAYNFSLPNAVSLGSETIKDAFARRG